MVNSINVSGQMLNDFEKNAYLHIRQPVFDTPDFVRLRNYLLSYVLALPPALRGTYFTGNLSLKRPAYADWVGAPPLVQLVEQFLGPDIAFFNFALCYKPPHSEFRVGPHIDSHYWIEKKCIEPSAVLVVFIPLTPARSNEGCLRVLPGINVDKMYRHRKLEAENSYFHWEIEDESVDLSRMIDLEMDENEVCLMKSGLIHGSEKNSSLNHRLGLTIRYISTAASYTPFENDPRKMILLKGKNLAGNSYYAPTPADFAGGFSWSPT